MTGEEYWMGEARKFEAWFYRANYLRTQQEADNGALRELVQRMRRYMVDAVKHCGYDAQTTGYTMLGSRLEECEEAMRELGIEVDS